MGNCCQNPLCKKNSLRAQSLGPVGDSVGIPFPDLKRILHATDFTPTSNAAFKVALRTCKEFGSSLTLLHVYEPPPAGLPGTASLGEDYEIAVLTAKQQLRDMRRVAMQEGVLCEADVCCGIASQSILDAIESNRIDLAIVGTKARHGVTRFWFGSTAEDVLRNAICPVMTIGPHAAATMEQEKKQGPVVFATDFSTATLPAIRYACRFRETTQLPLYCLNVLPRSLESVPTGGSLQHVLNDGLSHLAKESGAVEPMPICATSYGSDISYAIVEYAREQHAKMIVLGVRQASMLKSHLPVHVTFRVITEAPCPVVTMAYSSTSAETAMLTAISVQ